MNSKNAGKTALIIATSSLPTALQRTTLTAVYELTNIVQNPDAGFDKALPHVYCLRTGTWRTVYKAVTDCLSVWAVLGSNLGMGKYFFPSPKRADRIRGLPSLLCNGYRGSYPGRHEVNQGRG